MSDWNVTQNQKISIGVVVEVSPKAKPSIGEKDETAVRSTGKKFKSSQGKTIEEDGGVGVGADFKVKGTERQPTGKFPTTSSQITFRDAFGIPAGKTPSYQTGFVSNAEVNGVTDGWKIGKSGKEKTDCDETGEEIDFQTVRDVVLDEGEHGITTSCGRNCEDNEHVQRVEDFAFGLGQEMHVVSEGIDRKETEKATTGRNEALRVKLWEILGTATSPVNEAANSPTPETETKISKQETWRQQKFESVKPKLNSDTIETDSESPNATTKRPLTRSMTRNRCRTRLEKKIQHVNKNCENMPPSVGSLRKSIFTFDDIGPQAGRALPVTRSLNCRSKKKEKENSRSKSRRIRFSEEKISANSFEATKRERLPHLVTSRGSRIEKSSLREVRKLPKRKAEQQKKLESPPTDTQISPLQKNVEIRIKCYSQATEGTQQERENRSTPMSNNTSSQEDVRSPTWAMETPKGTDSPRMPQSKRSPIQRLSFPEGGHPVKGFSSLSASLSPQPTCGAVPRSESSHGGNEFESPLRSSPRMKDNDGQQLFSSSQEEDDSNSTRRDERIIAGFRARGRWSSRSDSPESSPDMLHGSKSRCSQEKIKVAELSPTSPCTTGSEESRGTNGASDQSHEFGLASAIRQLALLLERFKTKVKLQAKKKCSEILASAADRIHLELQKVESQIEIDVGKFTTASRSKRKRLEARFEEQQEKLNVIHHKFKEEVSRHLHSCKCALKELEAYQIELKGAAEMQSASHRKMLSDAEGAIGIQLDDSGRRIAAVDKAARRKMQGLDLVMKEFLGETV